MYFSDSLDEAKSCVNENCVRDSNQSQMSYEDWNVETPPMSPDYDETTYSDDEGMETDAICISIIDQKQTGIHYLEAVRLIHWYRMVFLVAVPFDNKQKYYFTARLISLLSIEKR